MHYKLQHWPILYNIFAIKLELQTFAIFTFHLFSCNRYLHFWCKSHCRKHLKWWNHYSQNDFKSSLLLSFMCERKSNLPKMHSFFIQKTTHQNLKSLGKTMMYHNIMKRSLALKDSKILWNQNSSMDIINVKLCLRPQKEVLNPWSILILRSTNDLINIWNQPKNLKNRTMCNI
jgi:hypothetical protein